MVAFLAALQAGSADTTAISENMQARPATRASRARSRTSTRSWPPSWRARTSTTRAPAGPIDFDENGDVSAAGALYELWQFVDGELTIARAVEFGA